MPLGLILLAKAHANSSLHITFYINGAKNAYKSRHIVQEKQSEINRKTETKLQRKLY